MNFLIISALILILILAIIAGYFSYKVSLLNKQKQQQLKSNQDAWEQNRNELIKDIHFIANSMFQQQCEITEGCMRLEYLINKVDDSPKMRIEFQHIYAHYDATAAMPIREAYQALTKKEQFKLDKARAKLEAQNNDNVLSDAKKLASFPFDTQES
jgi:predicted metal-binding transcription factor (methanogenesis marker protein 9)